METKMLIAITAQDETPDSVIDPRFGRAARFVLYDDATDTYAAHDNTQNLQAAQGAGIQAAQTVSELGADWVLTGHCGPKAFRVLQAAGIRVAVGCTGTVREAVEQFRAGDLHAADTPDVEGHWA